MRLLLFESVHRVMQAEKKLKGAGVPHEMLPTPKEYSRECGMCIGLEGSDEDRAKEILGPLVSAVVDGKGLR